MLLTALHSIFEAKCVIDAAINYSHEYNNNDSDFDLSKNGIIHRYNTDNNQYEINESDISLRDSYAKPLLSSVSTSTIVNTVSNNTNFLITDFLSDGEVERRIHYDGVIAKETRISLNE